MPTPGQGVRRRVRGGGYLAGMNTRSRRLRHLPEPAEKEIAHAAYYLWEAAGRPAGRDQDFWFTAREILCHALPDRGLAKRARSRPRNAQPRLGRIR
jgi:hypothetical protein